MSGNYHIIHADENYSTRRVICYESGRYHRHQTHEERYVQAACGTVVSPDRGDFCNISIANPNWNYDWCHVCVRAFPWTDGAKEMWRKKGITASNSLEWDEWLKTPEGKSVWRM